MQLKHVNQSISRRYTEKNKRLGPLSFTMNYSGLPVRLSKPMLRQQSCLRSSSLGPTFPSRALYISRLRPQTDVASFEVKDLKIQIMDYYAELYRADVMVHYKSLMNNKERDYHNSIRYKRTNGTWQIVEWSLDSLTTDKGGDFYKLSRGHHEWQALEDALRNKDRTGLKMLHH